MASFYPIGAIDSDFAEYAKNVESRNMVADLKPLSNGTAAAHLHGVIVDQLKSVGCPTWLDSDPTPGSVNHLDVWILNTDAGGDIAKCRRNIESEVAAAKHIVVWGVDCLMHQYHLIVRSVLTSIEHGALHIFGLDPGYWRRLCSILAVWRDKARAMHKILSDHTSADFSAHTAKNAARLPPRSLVGRWGNITHCENHILAGDELAVRRALLQVAEAGKERKRQTPNATKNKDDIDDALEEAKSAYTQKMSKECLSVTTSAKEDGFWTVALIANRSRKPLDHLFFWLQKQSKKFHCDALGGEVKGFAEAGPASVCQLVCYKAAEFERDFETSLTFEEWQDVINRVSGAQLQSGIVACIIAAVLGGACSFRQRVSLPCKQYPRRLFLLISEPPSTSCDLRQSEAEHLLALGDDKLDANTLKIRRVLQPYLQEAASTGKLPHAAFNWLSLLGRLITGDAQEIEGINNVAKNIVKQAPKSALSLVSCRTVHRKLLGLGRKDACRKWSSVAQRFNELRQSAIECYPEHNDVLGGATRFAASPPRPFLRPAPLKPPIKSNARTCALKWYWKQGKRLTANQGLLIRTSPEHVLYENALWIQAWTYSLESYFAKCGLTPRPEGSASLKLCKPFVRNKCTVQVS